MLVSCVKLFGFRLMGLFGLHCERVGTICLLKGCPLDLHRRMRNIKAFSQFLANRGQQIECLFISHIRDDVDGSG